MPTWMNRTKEAEAARQAAARERRQKAGNCIRCGIARDPNSKQLCTKHLEQQRDTQITVECDGCSATRDVYRKQRGRPSLPSGWGSCGRSAKRIGEQAYWCERCIETGHFNHVLEQRRAVAVDGASEQSGRDHRER
jgi:hypothetical protein